MHKIKEAVIVEGNYDKIKLSGFLDGIIITTHGFAVYTNDDYIKTIQELAKKTGIVILTDSDSAGMRIRNFIKQTICEGTVRHAYIPDIEGKEKRKREASKEGLLGVEGMTEEVIIKALRDAGCEIDDIAADNKASGITKTDLYMLGLSGGTASAELRQKLSKEINIPARISANMLLDVLNRLYTYDELVEIVQRIKE
ncbi:MAG: DUF4093 domain-containing protein [Clostridia bacterium]|nr:DUF4093 domain-containing protein [Clostridia bacterium]